MLSCKQAQEAMGIALTCIKKRKNMARMKYPLFEKNRYKMKFYFTDAEDDYYLDILNKLVHRKKDETITAPNLYCFEYDHKRDFWFAKTVPELVTMLEELFTEYYDKNVNINPPNERK